MLPAPHQIPLFISIAFLFTISIPVIMISNLVANALEKKKIGIIGFYILYFLFVTLLSYNGAFSVVSLPPRIIIITTIPLLLFYLLIVANTRFYKSFLENVQLNNLVKVHIFRLIGSIFIILYFLNQLPKTIAFIAGFGDIITALSSLYVASLIKRRHKNYKTITLIWNSFGLLDIFITSATAIILTKLSIETGSMGLEVLSFFPFCFIPAFAPATIVFLHLSVFIKMIKKYK